MLKHAFASAKSDGTDATQVQPSAWNADHVIDSGGATMATRTDAPTAPSAGNLVVYGKDVAGSQLPAFVGPNGTACALQPFIGTRRFTWWQPLAGSAATTGALFGFSVNTIGTLTARSVATTNLLTASHRTGFVSAATSASRALAYGSANYWRGNASGLGGFRAVFRFGVSDALAVATANMFAGFAASSSIGSGSTEPSIATNIFGVGCDSTDTVLQLYTNDGTGTATKTSMGVSFPANTLSADAYELALYAPSNGSFIGYRVTRLNTGDVAIGSVTTDLPAAGQLMLPVFMRGNMATALAVGIDVLGMYIETES